MNTLQIELEIPEAPKSPNAWLGKKFAKHNETKKWEKRIASAVLTWYSKQDTAIASTRIMRSIAPNQSLMLSSILASLIMTKTSKSLFVKKRSTGRTKLCLTFAKVDANEPQAD